MEDFQPGMPGPGNLAFDFASSAERGVMIGLGLGFIAFAYLILTLDRRRDGSPSRDDTQLGIKLVLWGLLAVSVLLVAQGAQALLAFVLGGFKGGWRVMRDPLATIAAGGLVGAGVYLLFLPRTNNQERPQVERFAIGLIGAFLAIGALVSLDQFLTALLAGAAWTTIAAGLAGVGVNGGLGVLAITRLGAMSGWRAAPRAAGGMPPGTGYPPTGTGYPATGTGYPPLGGGYPPQGGGYPPQGGGGGYPPTGSGWPQQ